MEIHSKEYFKQVRGDGTKYYYAQVTFKKKVWFWDKFETKYLYNYMDMFYLSGHNEFNAGCRSLEECKDKLDQAIDKYLNEIKRETVVSYKKINYDN